MTFPYYVEGVLVKINIFFCNVFPTWGVFWSSFRRAIAWQAQLPFPETTLNQALA